MLRALVGCPLPEAAHISSEMTADLDGLGVDGGFE
jgi:hypothetical protein